MPTPRGRCADLSVAIRFPVRRCPLALIPLLMPHQAAVDQVQVDVLAAQPHDPDPALPPVALVPLDDEMLARDLVAQLAG